MKKSGFLKISYIIISILLFVSLFVNYQYYKDRKQANSGISLFMNDFYYEIDEAIDTIDELMNDEAENIENRIRKLTDQLTILEYMLSRVKAYMSDRGAVPTDIKDLNSIIIYGTTYEGHHIPPFAQNNRINEQEKAFLQEIRNFLLTTSDRLGTDEKKKINPAISFTEFQDIISENIYGEFIYRKFLDVYIDAGSD